MQRKWMMSGAIGALFLTAGSIAVAQVNTDASGPRTGRFAAMLGDANGDGNVTKAEAAAAMDAHFAKMDVNKDGRIDKADREAARTQRQDAWFAKVDTDRNGQLSKPELAAGKAARAETRDDAGPKMGHPGRGGRFMRGHGGRGGEGRGGMMGRMADTDKDGAISRNEFAAAGDAMFAKADANKDGTVTAAEMQAARGAMRGRWGGRHGGSDTQPGN